MTEEIVVPDFDLDSASKSESSMDSSINLSRLEIARPMKPISVTKVATVKRDSGKQPFVSTISTLASHKRVGDIPSASVNELSPISVNGPLVQKRIVV